MIPVQGTIDPVLLVQEAAGLCRGEIWKRDVSDKETRGRQVKGRGRGTGGKGSRKKNTSELGEERGGPKRVDGCPDTMPFRSGERGVDLLTSDQLEARDRRVKPEDIDKQEALRIAARGGVGKRHVKNIIVRPLGEVRIPMGFKFRPRFENGVPRRRDLGESRRGKATSQPEDPFIKMQKFMIQDGSPHSDVGEEGLDPLSLEGRNLGSEREETETTLKARTATNGPSRRQTRVVVPDGVPSEVVKLGKESGRRRRQAAFIPKLAGEESVGEKCPTLE